MNHEFTSRVHYLDSLRIIATIGVICIHVSSKEIYSALASYNWYLSVIFDGLVRWSVPIFVMISGTLFLNPSKQISHRDIIKKNILRLLLAYISWWIFYSVLVTACHFVFDNTFALTLTPHYHLWFLPMLIGIYFLIPIIRKISTDKKITLYCLTIWFIYISGSFIFINEVAQISELFSINIVIGFSGYFLLGHFISTYTLSRKQIKIIYILGVLGLVITIAGCILSSLYSKQTDLRFFEYLSPHTILTSTALFVFIKEKSNGISLKKIKFINYIRKDLFGIYLLHPIFILIFNHDIFRNLCNHIITIPVVITMIFIFSLYTSKLLRLTPLRKIIE